MHHHLYLPIQVQRHCLNLFEIQFICFVFYTSWLIGCFLSFFCQTKRWSLSLSLFVASRIHDAKKLIFVYYLHQQCLVYLSRFYSRLMSVYQLLFFPRKKKRQSPFFFFSFRNLYSFESIVLGIFTSYSSLYSQSCYTWIFHMSSCACACVCAFVYVNNLCVDVCHLTNNA